MEFTPLTQIKPLDFTKVEKTSSEKTSSTENATPFSSIFSQAIDTVNQTDSVTKKDSFLLAQGESDDLHTLIINSSKAGIAVDMMVALRNRALDAYNEIMRMNI